MVKQNVTMGKRLCCTPTVLADSEPTVSFRGRHRLPLRLPLNKTCSYVVHVWAITICYHLEVHAQCFRQAVEGGRYVSWQYSALGLMARLSCTKKRSSNCAESIW